MELFPFLRCALPSFFLSFVLSFFLSSPNMRPTWLVRCFFERPFVVQGPLPSAATSQPSRGSRFYSGLSGLGTRLEGRRPLRQETVLERSSRFASDYRWDPTEELDRQESDRKVLDDFFESPETPGLELFFNFWKIFCCPHKPVQ